MTESEKSCSRGPFGPAPFSTDEVAEEELKNCDYSIKVSMEDAKEGKAPRKVRVYADGIFDLFHIGHARQLMQAKLAFPNVYLIAGVCGDAITRKCKGELVMNAFERCESVRHCRYVDEVVKDAPWSADMEFLERHKIDFVAHDDLPYGSSDSDDVYEPFKIRGMFLATSRTEGISTTGLIARIVSRYNIYIQRNLKRGVPRQDLNISYVKEKRIQIREKYESIRKRSSDFLRTHRKKLADGWRARMDDIVQSFLQIFNPDRQMSRWLNDMVHYISPQESPRQHLEEEDDDDITDTSTAPKRLRLE